jgi:CheY-like chemotaxis protein
MKQVRHTILLAEDDLNDQVLIKLAFRNNGFDYPIHVVNDGAQAVAYLKGEGRYADRATFEFPTFIITDLKMPVLDGFGVLQFLKSELEFAVIPTIVLSASSDDDDIKKAFLVGSHSYFTKPRDLTELEALIKRIIEYWRECEVPQVHTTGKMLMTESHGKLGERIPQPGA